jgi:formate dehydrogenase subunit gamma
MDSSDSSLDRGHPVLQLLRAFFQILEGEPMEERGRDLAGAHPLRVDGQEEKLPEIGKYNAGQKVVFWGMTFLILVLIATGLVIWDQYFSDYTNITQKRIAVLIHAMAAVTIICVWIVHVYAAIWLRGTMGAMIRGQVTGGWAWRHHRKWLKELVTRMSPRAKTGTTPAE